MKILLITLEYPPQKGGVASYYDGMAKEIRRQGYEVEVISGGRRWFTAYFGLRKAIKKLKPDIIFVGQILPLGTAAYFLRKRAPYVVFTHGMDILTAQKSWRKRWLVKKILKQAKLVVANSEFTQQQFTVHSSQFTEKSVVVYPCPNITPDVKREEVEALRRKLGFTGKKVLLTLGRVVERKGHDLVIKALPEILKHLPNVVYVVAGDGPYLPYLVKLIEDSPFAKGLSSIVRFVGEIAEDEKPLYYALCDLFVMPSRQIGPDVEGFGLSFLEAAAFGKPSIGGQSGGVSEAILHGETGVIVDPNDSNALARVVVQLLRDDGLRNELGQNAKSRAVNEFNWGKQARVLINRIDRLQGIGYNG